MSIIPLAYVFDVVLHTIAVSRPASSQPHAPYPLKVPAEAGPFGADRSARCPLALLLSRSSDPLEFIYRGQWIRIISS